MYAIRSYYGRFFFEPFLLCFLQSPDELLAQALHDVAHFPAQLRLMDKRMSHLFVVRITSYNVCYTKLLRAVFSCRFGRLGDIAVMSAEKRPEIFPFETTNHARLHTLE